MQIVSLVLSANQDLSKMLCREGYDEDKLSVDCVNNHRSVVYRGNDHQIDGG